nr:hypothetical protein [Tanacetum cinerariifolium]
MALPPSDQRHLWLQYRDPAYIDEIVHDFKDRIGTIFSREVNRVRVLDLEAIHAALRQDLAVKMRMTEFMTALDLHTAKEMAGDNFGAYWAESLRKIADKGDLAAYWTEISFDGDFLSCVPSYRSIQDHVRKLC